MNYQKSDLPPGLYLVATPIGHARDITLRALDVLASADILAAEDTRTLMKLMQIHGVPREGRPLVAYHDHAGPAAVARIAAEIAQGRSVAYSSEAGSPLISDPGYGLVGALVAAGHPVTVVPGPSAAVAALSLAGLPTDRFTFLGFPPAKGGARARWLRAAAQGQETSLIYESPRRLGKLLAEMLPDWGADRPAALCRELTKSFEEVRRGSLEELAESVEETPPKGECILVVGPAAAQSASAETLQQALLKELETSTVKTASQTVAEQFGIPRKEAYRMALQLKQADGQ